MKNIQIDPQNHEQQLAYELVANTNSSFFLTGRASNFTNFSANDDGVITNLFKS